MAKKPSLKDRSVTAREAALAYENTKKFSLSQPDDVMPDPHYRVPVSRQGKDRGAILRESEVVKVDDPKTPGHEIQAQRLCGGITRLYKQGAISEEMVRAGLLFQHHFERIGYNHYASVRLDTVGRGSGGIEAHYDRTLDSRLFVDAILRELNYPDTQLGKAAFWVLGHGVGLEEMTNRVELHSFKGQNDSRYWRAVVVSTLELIAAAIKKGAEGETRRNIRGVRNFSPSELKVRGSDC